MKRQEFIHQATIALAQKRDTATAEGIARFVQLLAAHVADLAPFDEPVPVNTREAERLIAINDGLRAAVAKTCTLTDALRQEIAAKAADVERLQLWLSRATDAQKGENEARVSAERSSQGMAQRLAYVLTSDGGSCVVGPASVRRVDTVPWEIRTEAIEGALVYRIAFKEKPECEEQEPHPEPSIVAVPEPEPAPSPEEAAPGPDPGTSLPESEIPF